MYRYLLFVLILSILAGSCKKKESMLERDVIILDEKLSLHHVRIYKAIKVLFRSATENKENEITRLSRFVLNRTVSGNKNITIKDSYYIYKTYNLLKDKLFEINEDSLPTIVEVLNKLMLAGSNTGVDFWNSSYEHLFLCVLLNEMPQVSFDYSLYEASKINEEQLHDDEIKSLALMYKSMIFTEAGLNHLAEYTLTKNIEMIESGRIKNTDISDNDIFCGKNRLSQIKAFCYLMRGVAKSNMQEEKIKDDIISDFTKFLKISEDNGFHNELSTIAGIYICYKQGNYAEAIMFLKKLKNNAGFDKTRKSQIDILIKKINAGKKINLKNDLLSVLNIKPIVKDYLYSMLTKNKYFEEMEKSKSGRIFIETPKNVYKYYKDFKLLKTKSKEYSEYMF